MNNAVHTKLTFDNLNFEEVCEVFANEVMMHGGDHEELQIVEDALQGEPGAVEMIEDFARVRNYGKY